MEQPAMLTLYAMPASYYSARVRSYLRKRRLPFEERTPGDPRFVTEIVPTLGQWIIPVLVLPDGTIIQDSAAILDHLDRDAPASDKLTPPAALGTVVAHLIYLLGGEGLLKAAMHYRWSFPENLDFLRQDFALSLSPPGALDLSTFERAERRMRSAAARLGVSEATIPAIEASYLAFLDALDAHLASTPYVLGDRPTLADYGLISPLHAHLGRDPVPAMLMKTRAPRVVRWIERMNAPDDDRGEYPGADRSATAVADNLVLLLQRLVDLFGAELRAHVASLALWLEDGARERMPDGTVRLAERGIGIARCDWQGVELESLVMPYRLFLLQRVQDAIEAACITEQAEILALLSRIGLGDLPGWSLTHRLVRIDNRDLFKPR